MVQSWLCKCDAILGFKSHHHKATKYTVIVYMNIVLAIEAVSFCYLLLTETKIIVNDCSWLYACIDKLALKSTVLPITYAESPYTLINGHHSLPSNVRSSPRDTCDDVRVTASDDRRPPKPETVSTPKKDSSLVQGGQPSVQVTQSTWCKCHHHHQHEYVHDNAVSSQSTPSCDVTQTTTEIPADCSVSSSLSSAASSSYMTSSVDVDDDVVDDATLRQRPRGTGSTSLRANARLSAVVSQLLGLAIHDDDDDDGRQATIDVDRLLRCVLTEPETVSTTLAGSVFELLDQAIADCGLDTAITVLLDALAQSRGGSTGGHLGHVIDLLRAVQMLRRLVASLDSADSEMRNCGCTCDVMRSDDAAEFDVQLTSLSDCVTDDVTLSRRLRYHSGGRHFRSRHGVSVSAYDDDNDFDHHLPALSVHLSGWCLCDRRRTVVLSQLLTDTRCVYELALVKTNLHSGLSLWLSEALRSNTSLIRLDLRLNSLGDSDGDGIAALGVGLSRHRRLRTLNLAGTGLTDTGLRRLLANLSANRKLAELDVGFNDFATGSGCLALGDALRMRRPPLRRLRMREDGITWSMSTMAPFFFSAARSPRLRYLDVSGNALGDDGVSQLSEALLVNRTLRELNVECCQFARRGCRALARALRSNDALRSLQISRNAIGDDGFAEIAGALRYNRAVTSLGANQCHVGNVGLSHLLDALRHNVTVTLVRLCYNDIGRHRNNDPGTDRRRRCRRLGIFMASCSSLQVVADDVEVTSRHRNVDAVSASGEWPSAGTLPTSGRSAQSLTFTLPRCVRSFNNVSSGLDDDVTPPLSELYDRLREVLHENARLKILLWGNKIDRWILESPVIRLKT